jgi:pimeloyl-ACP methyl ester carboxylesterase
MPPTWWDFQWVAASANLIPNAKMAAIKNCGHMTHREKPEEFNHLIKDFFSRL